MVWRALSIKSLLLKKSHKVKGAFTMGRSIKHEYDKVNDFWWIVRYDQADIFNYDGSLNEFVFILIRLEQKN